MSKSLYRYKNGQEVRVIPNIECGKVYYMRSGSTPGGAGIRAGDRVYQSWAGKIVHISHKANGRYKIMEDWKDNYFVDDMFEPVTPFACRNLL